jgi:DnaJ-class molecular chaperone
MVDSTAKPAPSDDPYAALGLSKSASEADIKKAYRRLVRSSHPDINPDDPDAAARFIRITAAHDLLKDPATRARFDAGEIDAAGQEKPERRYYRDFADAGDARQGKSGFAGMDPNDIFAEIFRRQGGGRTEGFSAAGRNLGFRLEVPFLDAARGGKSRMALPGAPAFEVTIPAALRDGQTLRLRGKGEAGIGGGPQGDAEVTVTIKPHPLFRREGEAILITLPITLDEAVLGAKIAVPTIHGDVSLTIPKGSNSGRIMRLRGRGVRAGGADGDQLVELRIVLPKGEDAELTAFMQTWRQKEHQDPREALLKWVPR